MRYKHEKYGRPIFQIVFLIAILWAFGFLYADRLVVGYYPSWFRSALPAEDILFENLTHINHAFTWPESNGQLHMDFGFIYPELNDLAHQNQVQVLISLGGWGHSDGFSAMAADSGRRALFINNLVDFLWNYGYDGVDIDWEFPNTVMDRSNLTLLIRELRPRFELENPAWLITFAVGTSDWKGQWYDYPQLIADVDWFNAMCYDYHGSWSAHSGHNAPLYQPPDDYCGAVDVGMAYLHQTRGIPKNQLTVGIPFYGKEFITSGLYQSFTGQVTDYYYSEIIRKSNSGWTYYWDNVSMVPYLTNSDNTLFITFDDTLSVQNKCEWIKDQGYTGAMIWALGQDMTSTEQPLLTKLASTLFDTSTTVSQTDDQIPVDFELKENYPNPFNPETTIELVLDRLSHVNLSVYNSAGQKVKTLVNLNLTAGIHRFNWTGDDDGGRSVTSGIYFCRMQSTEFEKTIKMVFIE